MSWAKDSQWRTAMESLVTGVALMEACRPGYWNRTIIVQPPAGYWVLGYWPGENGLPGEMAVVRSARSSSEDDAPRLYEVAPTCTEGSISEPILWMSLPPTPLWAAGPGGDTS